MPGARPVDPVTEDRYAAFARFYDAWASRMTEDVGFYVARALEADGPVVELAAGTGRVSIPIAKAGRDVVAVDASAAMIEVGRRRAAEAGVAASIRWVEVQMQRFVAADPTDLVVIPFRSFFHLTTTEDQLATLGNVHASLVPGGRLALNLFVPDPFRQAAMHGVREPVGAFVDEHGRPCEMFAESRYSPVDQRLDLRATCEVRDGGAVVETVTADLPARLIYRYEMEHLFARAGFEVEAVYGWFDERPLDEESREMIWVARRP